MYQFSVLHLSVLRKELQKLNLTNRYNWKGINCPSQKDDWRKNEKNSVTIAFNVLYEKKKKKIYVASFSKHNSNREKQV